MHKIAIYICTHRLTNFLTVLVKNHSMRTDAKFTISEKMCIFYSTTR